MHRGAQCRVEGGQGVEEGRAHVVDEALLDGDARLLRAVAQRRHRHAAAPRRPAGKTRR